MVKFARSSAAFILVCALAVSHGIGAAAKKRSRIVIKGDKIVKEQTDPDADPDTASPKMPKEFHLLAEGELPLKADGAIVLDGYTGKPLYEKNADLPLFPASTTKVMTALLVIEAGELDREVQVAEDDA